jgi:hypothetical protein
MLWVAYWCVKRGWNVKRMMGLVVGMVNYEAIVQPLHERRENEVVEIYEAGRIRD